MPHSYKLMQISMHLVGTHFQSYIFHSTLYANMCFYTLLTLQIFSTTKLITALSVYLDKETNTKHSDYNCFQSHAEMDFNWTNLVDPES